MRIALCFSGQPRFVKETYKLYMDNLIIPNNITDIFFHMWWDNTVFDKMGKVTNNPGIFWIDKRDLGFIVDNYKPIQILAEKADSIDKSPIFLKVPNTIPHLQVPVNNVKHSLYSAYRSILLKKQFEIENNFVYDCVIKIRTDIELDKEILIKDLNLNNISVNGAYNNLEIGWCNDYYGISNSSNMDIYSEIWHNFMDYNLNENCIFQCHQLLFHHLCLKNNLKIDVTPDKHFHMFGRELY
jgi:hypothetical protein